MTRAHAVVLATLLTAAAHAQPQDPAAERLATLHALLLDPARMFSISQTLAELDEIESQTAPNSPERGEAAYLRGFVQWKANRPGASIAASIEALRIDDAHPFLAPRDRLMTNDRIARQAKAQDDCRTALPYYRRLIALAAEDPELSDTQRLGMRADFGYCLHEAERYTEALAVNRAWLADAERLFGPEDSQLLPTLINIAQNTYELHDFAAARATLQRVLTLATQLHDSSHVDTALFQLGVLAYENGEPGEARRLMQERLRAAEQDGNRKRIAEARRDLNELERRLAR